VLWEWKYKMNLLKSSELEAEVEISLMVKGNKRGKLARLDVLVRGKTSIIVTSLMVVALLRLVVQVVHLVVALFDTELL
jgi:hypothetical protein